MSTRNSYRSLYYIWVYFISLDLHVWESDCTSPAEVDQHLQMGVQLLARGKLQDALSHFHAAIDGDPTNYLSYYRRATVLLALGRSRLALQDLDDVVKLKPDFTAARLQRANVLYKLGRLDEAHIDYEMILSKDPAHQEANTMYVSIEPLKQKIYYAQSYMQSGHYQDALAYLKDVIQDCPWDASMHELRVEAYHAVGSTMDAIAELRMVTKLTQDNTRAFFRLANLYYSVGDVEQSLHEIRECLKLDPDSKECFPFYKKLKKVNKIINVTHENFNNKEYSECVTNAKKVLREEPQVGEVRFLAFERLCQCEGPAGKPSEAITWCNKAIEMKPLGYLYCDRADAYLLSEMYEEAVSSFQKALEMDEHLQRAREGVQKAQKLKKQAGKRNYYKILGLTRSASKKDVMKAYRQLAQKWHPDHYSGEEKKHAEKMFIDIAAAKEVLTDDEKRAKFDSGEDPLDPEQQTSHGFNPFQDFVFQQGGFPGGGFGGGGPFKFKFQFN